VNLVAAASLALAPKPPVVLPEPRTGGGRQGPAAAAARKRRAPPEEAWPRARRTAVPPMIARGSGYDAVLRWPPPARRR